MKKFLALLLVAGMFVVTGCKKKDSTTKATGSKAPTGGSVEPTGGGATGGTVTPTGGGLSTGTRGTGASPTR